MREQHDNRTTTTGSGPPTRLGYGSGMSRFPEPSDPDDWSPMTSRPGEIFTIEGQSRARWAALRNVKNRDPRFVAYRNSMIRTGLTIIGLGLAVVVAVVVITENV